MAESPASPDVGLRAFHDAVVQTLGLTRDLRAGLEAKIGHSDSSFPTQMNSQTPIPFLSTAADILHSQITRLSLLALHPPFTPTALTTCLTTLVKVLPAFAAGGEDLIRPDSPFPSFVAHEVCPHVIALYKVVEKLLTRLPWTADQQQGLQDEDGGPATGSVDASKSGPKELRTETTSRQRVLSGTGMVWSECNWLARLKVLGVDGMAKKEIKNWRELAIDAVRELEEWSTGEEDDSADATAKDLEDSGSEDDDIDQCPPEFRDVVQKKLRQLRSILTIYPHLLVKLDSKDPKAQAKALDQRIKLAKDVSGRIDDIACNLYEEDDVDASKKLERLKSDIKDSLELSKVDKQWIRKWSDDMDRAT